VNEKPSNSDPFRAYLAKPLRMSNSYSLTNSFDERPAGTEQLVGALGKQMAEHCLQDIVENFLGQFGP